MTEKTVTLVPAVFPLHSIRIDPLMPVQCIKNSMPLKKGDRAFIAHVLDDGKCLLKQPDGIRDVGNVHEMSRFVELVTQLEEAANDNTPRL